MLINDNNLAAFEAYVLSDEKNEALEKHFVVGNPQTSFLAGLQDVWSGRLDSAKKHLADLKKSEAPHAEELHNELECLLNIKGWDQGEEGRKNLKKYLIKLLSLDFSLPSGDHAFSSTAPQEGTSQAGATQQSQIDLSKLDSDQVLSSLATDVEDAEQCALYPLFKHPSLTKASKKRIFKECNVKAALPGVVDFLVAHATDDEVRDEVGTLSLNQILSVMERAPHLKESTHWIHAVIHRMYPVAPSEAWVSDAQVDEFYKKVCEFSHTLPKSGSWVRAQVAAAKLERTVGQGKVTVEILAEYLNMARTWKQGSIYLPKREKISQTEPSSVWRGLGPLFPAGKHRNQDVGLVESAIHLLVTEEGGGVELFQQNGVLAGLLDEAFWKPLVAKALLFSGREGEEKWAKMYTDQGHDLGDLASEVDLEILRSNKLEWGVADKVALEIGVKNVKKLIVKVFEINAWNYCCCKGEDVSIGVDLEGLGPTIQESFELDKPPMRKEKFKYECLEGRRGIFVVEFVGGGRTSRALVKKGGIRALKRMSSAGQAFKILYEDNSAVDGAKIWMGGQEFEVDPELGEIVIPFGPNTGSRKLVIGKPNDMACSTTVTFEEERYDFSLKMALDTESLVPHELAPLILKPTLTVCGAPVAPELVEDVKLEITLVDADEVVTSQVIQDYKLSSDNSLAAPKFLVPDRLRGVRVTVSGNIKKMTPPAPGVSPHQSLSASAEYGWEGVTGSTDIHDVFLSKNGKGDYIVQVLGRCGESASGVALGLSFKHVLSKKTIQLQCATNHEGEVNLGGLPDIEHFEAWINNRCNANMARRFEVKKLEGSCTLQTPMRVEYGEEKDIYIPYTAAHLSQHMPKKGILFFKGSAGGDVVEDLSDQLNFEPGYVRIHGLPPGNYFLANLMLGTTVSLTVFPPDASVQTGQFTMGLTKEVAYAVTARKPLQITSCSCSVDEGLKVELDGTESELALANVVVMFNRFVPPCMEKDEDVSFTNLAKGHGFSAPGATVWSPILSTYSSNRALSDESRYVMERREQRLAGRKRPGNMLPKPSLLVNDWRIRETTTGVDKATRGGHGTFGSSIPCSGAGFGGIQRHCRGPCNSGSAALFGSHLVGWREDKRPQSLLFSPPSIVIPNLRCDENGTVSLTSDALKQHGIQDLANSGHTIVRVVVFTGLGSLVNGVTDIEGIDTQAKPLRNVSAATDMEAGVPLVEDRQVCCLQTGAALNIASSGKFKVFHSLQDVHQLFATEMSITDFCRNQGHPSGSSQKDVLAEFSFLMQWPSLSREQKLHRLSEYACYELYFFVKMRDPALFDEAVRPLIACKAKDSWQFMDYYLLDSEDLVPQWTSPSRYTTLNAAERCLLCSKLDATKGTMLAKDMRDVLNTRDKGRYLAVWKRAFWMALASQDTGDQAVAEELLEQGEEEEEVLLSLFDGGPVGSGSTGSAEAFRSLASGRVERSAPMSAEAAIRKKSQATFHQPQKAQEWKEMGYWKAEKGIIRDGDFWADFAEHLATKDSSGSVFLSKNIILACQSFTEAVFAMAVLGLPIQAASEAPKVRSDGQSLKITHSAPAIVFHTEIRPADLHPANHTSSIVLTQVLYDPADRYVEDEETGESFERRITSPLKSGKKYGYSIAITNSTSAKQHLELLLPVPEGSVVLGGNRAIISRSLPLGKYECEQVEYSFYFPRPGEYVEHGATVSKRGKAIGMADVGAHQLKVEADPKDERNVESLTWRDFSAKATNKELLEYLGSGNLQKAFLFLIAHRCHDKAFYGPCLESLRARQHYDRHVWAWSVFHMDELGIRELMDMTGVGKAVGPISVRLGREEVALETYEHLEYFPLINARAYQLKGQWSIPNRALDIQWKRFLDSTARLPSLKPQHKVEAAYYLVVQDRLDEAERVLSTIQLGSENQELVMQVDYMKAWLDLADEASDLAVGHNVATKYRGIQHAKWKKRFTELREVLEEIEAGGGDWEVIQTEEKEDTAPSMEVTQVHTVDAHGDILVDYRYIDQIEVEVFPMDVELLFSSSPFSLLPDSSTPASPNEQLSLFTFINPSTRKTIPLPDQPEGQYHVRIKSAFPDLANASALMRVLGGGLSRAVTRYGNDLRVRMVEKSGMIVVGVLSEELPAVGAYVKVFAKGKDGQVEFHKDGYTDRRGKFDYATLSSHGVERIKEFAILVVTEEHGVVAVSAKPPPH